MYSVDIGINDLASSKLQALGQLAQSLMGNFGALGQKLQSAFTLNANSIRSPVNAINQLQEKIAQLTQNRNASADFGIVKGLNREISQAQREMNRLQNAGTSNLFADLKNNALQAVPALGLITNPIVAGSLALSGATSMAMSFENGMAKVNSTLQLQPTELAKIKNQLIQLGQTSNVDLAQMPNAFEKIVSAVGDAGKSMEIFKSSLKASKAGFTDINVVADAGAAILANYNGMSSDYAMDVLMKTKNLGKAEFGDLAKYMPQILPDAKRLGITFEEMAGSFAYFTSKGISVEQTTTYLKNMMKPLGDPDKIANLERVGVKIFEIGENGEKKMRPMVAIAQDMNKTFGKMDAVKRLEAFKGLEFDMEASAGFSLLMQDTSKLTEMMKGTKQATGETDKTLQFTGNTIDNLTQLTNQFKAIFLQIGDMVLPTFNTALMGVNVGLNFLKDTFSFFQPTFDWFYNKANLLIPVIGTLAGMYALWNANIIANSIAISILNGITLVFNGMLAIQNMLLSLNPVALVAIAIIGLGAALVACYENFAPFRNAVDSVFSFMKSMVDGVIESVNWLIEKIRDGLEWVGLLDKNTRLQKEKAAADDKAIKSEEDKKQKLSDTKAFSEGKGLFLNAQNIKNPAENKLNLPFIPTEKTGIEKLTEKLEIDKNKKKDNNVLGTGNTFDAFKNNAKFMTPEEKKSQKAGGGKLSLGTFGVEGDTRQAKNITVHVGTLGGIQEIKIIVGNASEVTPELKQKINDGVREALIGSVRDFEIMY